MDMLDHLFEIEEDLYYDNYSEMYMIISYVLIQVAVFYFIQLFCWLMQN